MVDTTHLPLQILEVSGSLSDLLEGSMKERDGGRKHDGMMGEGMGELSSNTRGNGSFITHWDCADSSPSSTFEKITMTTLQPTSKSTIL